MSVKVIYLNGHWTVRVNWHKRRMSHRVQPNTEAEAIKTADIVRTAIKAYGEKAFEMFSPEPVERQAPQAVRQFVERWLQEMGKSDLKLSTKKYYSTHALNHIIPDLGGRLIADLDYAICKQFILTKTEARKPPYSRDTIRSIVATLSVVCDEAVKEKLLTENPTRGLAQFYRSKRRDRTVTRKDVYTLDELYAIEDRLQNRALYGDCYELALVLSRTGMRIGEARAIEADDIDWKARQIHITKNIPSGTGVLEDSAKSEAGERWVDMSGELVDALKAMIARHKAEALRTGQTQGERLFDLCYQDFSYAWKRAQAQAGVRYRPPHSIRHTYASQLLATGTADLAWLARQLGHSNPAVTLSIYAHFIPGKKAGDVDVMDRERVK